MPRKKKRSKSSSAGKTSRKSVSKEPLRFPSRRSKPSGLAIFAFLFSLLSFALVTIKQVSWALSLIAIIFATVSLKKKESKGLAIISIIIALIAIIIWMLLVLFSNYNLY